MLLLMQAKDSGNYANKQIKKTISQPSHCNV